MRFIRTVFFVSLSVIGLPAAGQIPGQPSAAPQATPSSATQTPGAQPAAAAPAVPDYPDPRTLTIGVFYWLTGPGGTNPSIYGGSQAPDYETLTNFGQPRRTPGAEVSYPITRTGELHLEYEHIKGEGNQNAPAATDLSPTNISQGDYLATQYSMQHAKLYLEDLLWPHKFPVAKFRVRSLWEVQWVQAKSIADAPLVDASGTQETATITKMVILPTFGLSAEYALSKHMLVRVAATGFGIPHHSDIWDGEATVGYRFGSWDIRAGGKAFHFKSSPNAVEYESATFTGAFVGLRWHWSL